jgi:hypothetical protein
MDDYESLSHTKWECKYHVVWRPLLVLPLPRRRSSAGWQSQGNPEVPHHRAQQGRRGDLAQAGQPGTGQIPYRAECGPDSR